MANKSKTSISIDKCVTHIKSAPYQEELPCSKITGFHLKKTKTGGTWRLRYSDLAKKRRVLTLGRFIDGTKDRIEAAELALTYRGKVEEGADPSEVAKRELQAKKVEFVKSKSNTLGLYLEGSYTEFQFNKANNGTHTLNMIRGNFKDWLDIPMSEITKAMVREWQRTRVKDGIKHSTIERAYGALRKMLNQAIEEDILTVNPIQGAKLAEAPAKETAKQNDGSDKKKRRMFTNEELAGLKRGIKLFKQDIEEKENRANYHAKIPSWFFHFYHLAAYTGFRPGDLYNLNWYQLDLNARRIIKTPKKTQHHKDPCEVNAPLRDHILAIMKEWHIKQGSPTEGLVFPNPYNDDKEYDRQAHDKNWKRLLKLGNITADLHFYSLRHHLISSMITKGVILFEVAKLAGHKSTRMIEKHYGHIARGASDRAYDLVSGDFEDDDDIHNMEVSK